MGVPGAPNLPASELRNVLDDYTDWLIERGYCDIDAINEEPLAAEEYIKERGIK